MYENTKHAATMVRGEDRSQFTSGPRVLSGTSMAEVAAARFKSVVLRYTRTRSHDQMTRSSQADMLQ